MKPYYILPCYNLIDIQKEVYNWIKNKNKNLLNSKSLWNKIDIVELLTAAPSVKKYFLFLNLKLKEVAITILTDNKDVTLHIDELPVTAKINIPILNTKNTFNQWYKIPKEIMSKTSPSPNEFGKNYYFFKNIDFSKLNLLGEVECTKPIVFNSQLAHNIIFKKKCKFPRIVLSCTFFKEPLNYLQD